MSDTQSIEQLFAELVSFFDDSERDQAMERLHQVMKGPIDDAEVICELLRAEKSQSFFEDRHQKQTGHNKQRFNFQVADQACKILAAAYPTQRFESERTLFPINADAEREVSQTLSQDGVCVLPQKLDLAVCDRIIESLSDLSFRVKATGDRVNGYRSDTIDTIRGNTSWIVDQQDVLNIPEVQQFASDPTILNLVQDYLGCVPIHDQANCWWTINHRTDQRSMKSDAQLYHQDKDFVRFVKVFVYLNDVDERNGPHSFIRGSARDYEQYAPEGYRMMQRVEDGYLEGQYESDRFLTIQGDKGTVVLEDTSGFHKGTPVVEGHRLMLQLEYCCSLYFNPGLSFTLEGLTEEYREFAQRNPRMFMMYDHDRYLVRRKKLAANDRFNARKVKASIRQMGRYLESMVGLRKSA
ncbi:MAG: phytanoyl-CoA dioxygenase family protein [Planctomycetota bacterium]